MSAERLCYRIRDSVCYQLKVHKCKESYHNKQQDRHQDYFKAFGQKEILRSCSFLHNCKGYEILRRLVGFKECYYKEVILYENSVSQGAAVRCFIFTLILQFGASKIILFLVFQKLQAPIAGLFPKVSILHPISVLLWAGRIFLFPVR